MGNFMKTIDVSFVIPVYNDSNYIDKCIECINNQGLDSFEIIFVDDCSTDNSVEIININNNKYNNIVLIKNNENMGPGYSRNRGTSVAKGKYIRFIDCDDELVENSTKILFDYAELKKYNIVRGGYISINEDGKEIFRNVINDNIEINSKSSSDNILKTLDGHWCYLFNKEFLIKNNLIYKETARQAEDSYLLQNVFFKANNILFVKDIVYRYIVHKSGRLTNDRSVSVVYNFQSLFENFLNICLRIGRMDLFYKRFINSFNYIYIDRFFSVYNNFNKNEKTIVITRLKKMCEESKFLNKISGDMKKLYESKITKNYRDIINDICVNEQKVINMSQNDLIRSEFISHKNIYDAIKYKNSIPLYAWTGHLNFGDVLIFDILNKFHISYHLCTLNKCKVITVGSILHNFLLSKKNPYSSKKLHCWGSGFISNKEEDLKKLIGPFVWEFNRKIEFHALRGLYSQTMVEKIINEKLSIPLGDPGLLINRVMPEERSKKYDVGIVLHWKESINDIKGKIQLKDYSVKYISPEREPTVVINEIKECNCILSSSLHGLIVADSFCIPNRHILVSSKVEGGGFKFKDYYSAYKNYPYRKLDLNQFVITDEIIDRIVNNYDVKKDEINRICNGLLDSFPAIAMQFNFNILRYIKHLFNPLFIYKR